MASDIIERLREQSKGMLPSGEYAFLRKKDIAELLDKVDGLTRNVERWQADALRLLIERNAAQEERDELVSIADKASKERDEARQKLSERAMDALARLDEMLDPSAHLTFRRATTPRKEPHGND